MNQFGESNPNARLTDEDVRLIRELAAEITGGRLKCLRCLLHGAPALKVWRKEAETLATPATRPWLRKKKGRG